MAITAFASKARWVSILWSAGMSLLVAVTDQAVPALVVPVAASILLFMAPRSPRVQVWLGIVACAILLGFMILAVLSVGWFYLPSLVAAAGSTAYSRDALALDTAASPLQHP